jgi:hypothetical protein
MTKLTLACALIMTLAACASNTPPPAMAVQAPAVGTQPAATVATQAAAPVAAKPKIVCEESKPTGSLIPQRICMTPEEQAQRRKAAQDAMRTLQAQSAINASGSSSGG